MTQETSMSGPARGPDAPGGTPYPDIADTSHATAAAAAFFRSFFTAKTRRDIEATHAHFHPATTAYFDATLGWALASNGEVRKMWEQYMPRWPAGARSYPTRILGDMTGAVLLVTDTPELFGGEIRTITIADLEDGRAAARPGRHDHQVHHRVGRLPARRPGHHRARRRRGRQVTLRTQPDSATPVNPTHRKETIMTTTISLSFAALTIDSADPAALADFWGKALGRPVSPGAVAGDTAVDATGPEAGPRMILHHPPGPGTAKNSVHPVLVTDHHDEETERLTALGARPLNQMTVPPTALPPGIAAIRQTTFADPEGNEFDLVTWQPE